MARYIQDPKTGKLILAHLYRRASEPSLYIHGDIESFVSPIDGSTISDRAQLRKHNEKHGVTDSRDYGPEWFGRKEKEREQVMRCDSEKENQSRREHIFQAIQQHEGR